MDKFDGLLTQIIERVQNSTLSEEKKADIYAQISIGLRKLVWPILISRIPEQKLADTVSQSQLTLDQYSELIESALHDPNTSRELHDSIIEALIEINTLLTKNGIPQATKQS